MHDTAVRLGDPVRIAGKTVGVVTKVWPDGMVAFELFGEPGAYTASMIHYLTGEEVSYGGQDEVHD